MDPAEALPSRPMSTTTNSMKHLTKIQVTVVAGFFAACGLVALAAVVTQPSFNHDVVFAFVEFVILAVLAVNLDVIARSSFSVSGSTMILIASIVVFGEYSFFLGPALVGVCGGVLVHRTSPQP